MRILRLILILAYIYIFLKRQGIVLLIPQPSDAQGQRSSPPRSAAGGRWIVKLGLAFLLGLVYILITGVGTVINGIVGLVIGITLICVCSLGNTYSDMRQTLKRLGAVPRFAVGTAQELMQGSWTMLRVLLGLEDWRKVGFIKIPVGERSPTGAIILALVATAAPGGVLITIDWHEGMMIFNVIDASHPEAINAHWERFYQKFQRPMLP